MTDESNIPPEQVDEGTPASAHPDAPHRHGDALLDESGSRQGEAPDESVVDDGPGAGDA